MTDDRLELMLGGQLPAGIAALPAEDRAELARVIAEARRAQADGLAGAFRITLKHIPLPLRGAITRALLR